ncbi:MAG: hypothetical protein HY843_05160 [Bdellovibrio sp.]|nr:hypothetical protein [Bdellovibrio sp.]
MCADLWHTLDINLKHLFWLQNLAELDLLLQELTELYEKTDIPKTTLDFNMIYSFDYLSQHLKKACQTQTTEEYLINFENHLIKHQKKLASYLTQNGNLMYSKLQEIALQNGKSCAQKRWPHQCSEQNSKSLKTTESLLSALAHTPWSGLPIKNAFFIKRLHTTEIQFQWLICPHTQQQYFSTKEADLLCTLYLACMQSYLTQLNNEICFSKIENKIKVPLSNQGCLLLCTLPQ